MESGTKRQYFNVSIIPDKHDIIIIVIVYKLTLEA